MDDRPTAVSEPIEEWLPSPSTPDTAAPSEQDNEPIGETFDDPAPGGL